MRKLGKKQLTLHLNEPIAALPDSLADYGLQLASGGRTLIYTYDTKRERTGITGLLTDLAAAGHRLHRSRHQPELARRDLRRSRPRAGLRTSAMNLPAVLAIYRFEMARFWRTALQSIVAPVIATSLYFVVFGAAIGSRVQTVDGIAYGAFIVPGLIMLSLLTQSVVQCRLRHLLPALRRYDLRALVRADLPIRGRARLCRRGGDQVDLHRPRHSGDGSDVRAAAQSSIRSGWWRFSS